MENQAELEFQQYTWWGGMGWGGVGRWDWEQRPLIPSSQLSILNINPRRAGAPKLPWPAAGRGV